MHTWDYDQRTLTDDEAGQRWKLERQILYGLGDEKLDEAHLRKHLPFLNIPEDRRYFLTLILQ